ncbi:MAG: hypothetical protein ABI406_20910 [Ktedonobacteraceae bacterium]
MASKPMLTFLEATLQYCYVAKTSVHEEGLTVSTEKLAGETILFFNTDCDEGRKTLHMVEQGQKICDYLIFYTKDNEKREIVCYLELKGGKLENAKKQVLNTHKRVRVLSEDKLGKLIEPVIWKACICLHGQAPRNGQRIVDELISIFGKNNVRIKHGVKHFKLLGEFLRG